MGRSVLEYDIVVIGSGAGGGTVAKELSALCASGCRIALLEWGGRFQAKDNLRREVTMAERYYADQGGFQTRSQDMTLAFARAVGGSTTVYTGTSLMMSESTLENWNISGLTMADLRPRYFKYMKENNVHKLEPREINENNRLFRLGCERLGWSVEQFPVNTKGCVGLGTCNLGCSRLAKQGTAVVQIPIAEQNGVELISFCRVERIEGNDVLAEIVAPEFGLEPSGRQKGRYRFRAHKIVVCAGSLNTTAILLRSFGASLSPALGRYFTCHPALMIAGRHPRTIAGTSGHPKSFFSDQFLDSERILLETCMYFPFTLAKSITGYGEEMDEFLSHFDRLQMILILSIDQARAENRISVDSAGRPVVDYRFSPEVVESLTNGVRRSAEILFAAGAEAVHAPIAKKFLLTREAMGDLEHWIDSSDFKSGQVSVSAAHLMGGARMGEDPDSSVTDSWGRLHKRPHVYVADAGLFPDAAGVNPYLTVMALADRVAEGIRTELGAV